MLAGMGFTNLPDFSGMAAVTFSDVIVSHGPFSDGLLFHELVHVVPHRRRLGIFARILPARYGHGPTTHHQSSQDRSPLIFLHHPETLKAVSSLLLAAHAKPPPHVPASPALGSPQPSTACRSTSSFSCGVSFCLLVWKCLTSVTCPPKCVWSYWSAEGFAAPLSPRSQLRPRRLVVQELADRREDRALSLA